MRHFGHGERRKMARVAALTLAAVLLRPALGWAMFDAFLKIDGVQGESTDARHSGEIEALAYHWGATQAVTGTVSDKGNITGSRVNMDALTITKALDSSSPLLAQNCAEGKVYPTVTLVLQRSGGSREKYMEYKLTNALVSSIQSGGAANASIDAHARSRIAGQRTRPPSRLAPEIRWLACPVCCVMPRPPFRRRHVPHASIRRG